MNPSKASSSTQFKVGLFTILGIVLIAAVTFFVNDKPYWWRGCDLVHINVEDATGLKQKSPVRSLGLQIGYLGSVELYESHVRLGICITAPVEVLGSTRAYLRAEGFLGDKFVELKPVKFVGTRPPESPQKDVNPSPIAEAAWLWNLLEPSTLAADPESVASSVPIQDAPVHKGKGGKERDIPVGRQSQDVQHLVSQVDSLVNEMTTLTGNLKEAINPQELKKTMQQLNRTLENASRTLSPEGGLNTTAQRTLAKLEDAIEQLRDQMARVNRGEGSVGMLLNDPSYAEEIKEAIHNANRLLSKVADVRFVVDMGAEEIPALDGGRGWFRLGIWPKPDRYYLLGISIDPRGKRSVLTKTVEMGGASTTIKETQIEEGGLLLTAMLGKVLFNNRLDFSIGALHGDGTVSVAVRLGPTGQEEIGIIRNDLYTRGQGFNLDDRVTLQLKPWTSSYLSNFYLKGGVESVRPVDHRVGYFVGAGFTFDDQDIKLLFALR